MQTKNENGHKKDLNRESILKIAREIFSKYGFKKTTLDDIANAVRKARFDRTGRGKAYDPDLQLHETEVEDAAAALAKVRETHHLIPKDQEPVGSIYSDADGHSIFDVSGSKGYPYWTETPLYTLPEKRHDD
jgi:hypothetical protein